MHIGNWPLHKITQLPDWVFGARSTIIFSGITAGSSPNFFISDIALPDRCVIWHISALVATLGGVSVAVIPRLSLSLADILPTSDAEYVLLETVLPGVEERQSGIRVFRPELNLCRVRYFFSPQGRRFTVRESFGAGQASTWNLAILFSSIPSEVPDWLVSG